MADNKYISLKVCGNQYANSGFMPLVSFNSPLFEVTDVEYGGFNLNSYFFTIKIEKSQVVYTMIKNNVRSCNAALREGSLKISMAIPKGYKISNGKSPYDALVKLKDAFISLCMTCKDSVKGIYEFNSGMISPTILDEVAKEFAIEQISGPYHPMSVGGPKGYITLPEEQISLLLSDVQYAEFSPYGEIVVAQSVQATNYTPIVNLQVPRESRFAIIVDGVEDGYVKDPNEEIPVRGKKDSRYYDNYQFSFCISDIRNGKNIPNVKIDEEKEMISIDTSTLSSPKQVKVSIEFDAEAQGYFYTIKENFQLSYNQRAIQIKEDYSFILTGEDIAKLANPEGFVPNITQRDRYIIEGKELIKNDAGEYFLKIKTKKVINTVPPRPQSDKVVKSKESDISRVEVLLNARPEKDFLKVYDGSKLVQSSRVRFSMSGTSYKSVIYIPKSYEISNLEVSYESPECVFKSGIIYDKRSETYTASHFGADKKTFIDRFIKPNRTLIASFISIMLGFILGCVLMYFAKPIIDKLFEPDPVFACGYCTTTFKSNDLLTAHVNSEHFKHPCATCGERFQTKEDLTSHINSVHMPELCDVCKKRFSSPEELTEHRNSAHFIHECEICHERFDTKKKLTDHKKTHKTPVVAKPFKCGSCNASFDERAQLEWHIKDKHNSKFTCRICGSDTWFSSMDELDNHMGSKHKHYECPHCGHDTFFATREGLNGHILEKHRTSER